MRRAIGPGNTIITCKVRQNVHRTRSNEVELMGKGNRKSFADYRPDGHNWITLATGEYYPDILVEACKR